MGVISWGPFTQATLVIRPQECVFVSTLLRAHSVMSVWWVESNPHTLIIISISMLHYELYVFQPGYWGLGNTVYGCTPCDCDIGATRRNAYITTFPFHSKTCISDKLRWYTQTGFLFYTDVPQKMASVNAGLTWWVSDVATPLLDISWLLLISISMRLRTRCLWWVTKINCLLIIVY